MTLLSIVVPVYNKEKYVDSCVKSILDQTFTDFELILVNDGSTDRSGGKCDYYAQIDNRVKVIHQENKGVSPARNAGLRIAKGKFVGFADSDDTLEKDMYEILINNILVSGSDISVCGIKKVYKNSETETVEEKDLRTYNKDQAIAALLKSEFWANVGNKVFKSEIARSVDFEGRFNEDVLYNFLTFKKSNKVVFQNICKYNYILRDNSVSIEKFSKKDLESLYVSGKIIDIISEEMPQHLKQAQVNDFVSNISVLNQILLSEKKNYFNEYNLVIDNLKKYSSLLTERNVLRKKHKYALNVLLFSPSVYSMLLQFYCYLIPSEAGRRGKKLD